MPLPVTGLVHVTGEPDTGKTTLALTVPGVQPSQIIFLDDDKKTQAIADALAAAGTPFGYYANLARQSVEEKINKPIDFYKMIMVHLDKAKKKVPDAQVVVFDNFDRMEGGIRSYSMSIMKDISDLSDGQIRGMNQMTWSYTYNVYAQFLDTLNALAPLLFVITHTRNQYINNTKTNILEARGQRSLTEKANLRIWTRHNPLSPAPVGLVLKRISRMMVTAEGMRAVNILPRRIAPCTWQKIVEYLNNPIGEREPSLAERPTEFELSILDGELTEDQKDAWRIARISAEREGSAENADMLPELDPKAVKARELQAAGYLPPQIARELEITIPQVLEFLK